MATPQYVFHMDGLTKAYAGGCVVSFMRPHAVWSQTPHAKALAELPVLTIEKIGEAGVHGEG